MHFLSIALLALAFTVTFFAFLFFGRSRLARIGIGIFLAVTTAAALFILPAAAQAVAGAPTPTAIRIDPTLISDLGTFTAALIVGLGMIIWKWIDTHSPLKGSQTEEIARGAFMDLLDKGAQFGATQEDGLLTRVGDVDVGNAAVAAGANFVMAHGPDLAKSLGFDIETAEGQAAIVRSITARLGTLLGSAGAPGAAPIYRIALPPAVLPPVAPAPAAH